MLADDQEHNRELVSSLHASNGGQWPPPVQRHRGRQGRMSRRTSNTYEPTRRRPPQIVQTTDAVAIYGRDGSLLRLSTSLHFRTNFSGRPDRYMDEIRHNITGLDHLPRDPSAHTWRLRRGGDLHSITGRRGGRQLATRRCAANLPRLTCRASFCCRDEPAGRELWRWWSGK